METKSAPLLELKTNSTPGEFTAVISAIGNVDLQGDRVMPNAFKDAIEQDPIPPVYWSHKHDIPPIGEGFEWKEVGNEVHYSGRLFVKGEVEHQVANQVYAGMKSYDGRLPAIRQFSFTYGVPAGGAEMVLEDGKSIRNLKTIRPVDEVGPCFIGANPQTGLISAAKAHLLQTQLSKATQDVEYDFFQLGEKADWDEEYLDRLPDSAFLHVAPGGKRDMSGRTEPRDLRHFPYKNAQGQIDMPHLRAVIETASKSEELPEEICARAEARAQRLLRAQEGKALLLGAIFSAKAWDDIEGYSILMILEMLDSATSYIQLEDDPVDVIAMQTIASSLIALLKGEFSEASDGKSAALPAMKMAVELYCSAAQVSPSDGASTVTQQEIARLLIARPSH